MSPLLLVLSYFSILFSVPCVSSLDSLRTLSRPLLHHHHSPLSTSNSSSSKCAVIFDAGSSGSRVHVYCFDENMDLINFGDGYEHFRKTSPGLSAYADDPEEGANSLRPLLNDSLQVVPVEEQAETPVRLGATAGLRLLPGNAAELLLESVSALFAESPFKFESEWVSILDGTQEGAFSWVSINYLLGNIGKDYGSTVGTVDLGGGSLQMSYGISDFTASKAPMPVNGEDTYVTNLTLLGSRYHLYVHSYLHFGLLAGRAEVLKLVKAGKSCPCIAKKFKGEYVYDSVTYTAVGPSDDTDFSKCRKLIKKALGINKLCEYSDCTFGGIWNGGGGDGQKRLYVVSYFFDRAMEAGIITDPNATEAAVDVKSFKTMAKAVCKLTVAQVGAAYPNTEVANRPYFCLDLAYEYTVLAKGFGFDDDFSITLVKQVNYKGSGVEAQWTLGSAIDVISSSSTAALM